MYTLQSRLAARAARGLLSPGEVEGIADRSALQNIPDKEVLQRLIRQLEQNGGDNSAGLPVGPLSRGVRSEAVRKLQFVLIELGIMDAYAIKYDAGTFGPETIAAVKHIQKCLRVPSTGVYDDIVQEQLLKMLKAAGAP